MNQEILCYKEEQNTSLRLRVFSMTAASRLDTRRANLYGKRFGIFGSPGMHKVLEAWLRVPAISGIDGKK